MGTGYRDTQMARFVIAHSQVVLLAWETGLTDFYTSFFARSVPWRLPSKADDQPRCSPPLCVEHVKKDNTNQMGGQGKGRGSVMGVYIIPMIF
jgi:hypothetical protein